MEKSAYTGPWKVPAKRRSEKDKNAPKRPMSAFLAYSHSRRAEIRAANPEMDNIDVSRELAKMWKVAPEEEKKVYIEKEAELRKQYKIDIAKWREEHAEKEAVEREQRQAAAMLKLSSMPTQYENELDPSLRQESMVQSLAAAASLAASSAARLPNAAAYPSNASSGYYASAQYGTLPSSYPSSYTGATYPNNSNDAWLSRAAETAAARLAYAQQEEQAAAFARANAYGNDPYNTGNNGAYDYSGATRAPGLVRQTAGQYDTGSLVARSAFGM